MAGGTLLIRVMPEKGVFGPALASEVEGSARQVESKGAGLGEKTGRALKLGLVGAVAGIGAGLVAAANLEQAEVAFTRFLGSGQRAQAFIGDLKTFSAKTPFELPGVIEQARNLLGVGLAAQDVIPMLRDFGDATAAVGLGQEQFNNIMLQVRQGIGAGRFQLEELNAIADNGLPIFQLLSQALGKSVPELRDMASNGQLLAADVLPALREQMHKDYSGSLEAQSQTLAGLFSNLKDSIGLALADGVQPLVPVLKDVLPDAAATAGAALKGLSTVFGLAFQVAGPLLKLGLDLAGTFNNLPGPIQAVAVALIAWRLGGGKVVEMLDGLRGKIRGAREEMALQRSLLAAQQRDAALTGAAYGGLSTRMAAATAAGDGLNASSGRVRAGLAGLGAQGGVIGGVAGGLSQVTERYSAASASASGFTGRLGAMTAAAGTAARVGIGGLVGALGGGWGLAIGAGVALLGVFTASHQKAAETEARHRSAMQSLTEAIAANNGEIDENITKQAAQTAAQEKGLLVATRSAGVRDGLVTRGLLGERDAVEQVIASLEAYAAAHTTRSTAGSGTRSGAGQVIDEEGRAALAAAEAYRNLIGAGEGAAQTQTDVARETTGAKTAIETSTGPASALGQAMAAYAEATGDAKAQSEALKRALDALNGVHLTMLEAQSAVNGAMDDFAEKLGAVDEKTGETAKSLVQANGEINTATQLGRDLQSSTLGVRDAMAAAAQAARDEAIAKGDSAGAAQAAGAAAQKVRDDFIDQAESILGSRDAAEKLATAYGLVPGSVVTAITTPGMTESQIAADILKGKIVGIPDGKTITTSALTADAERTLGTLGYTVTHLPHGQVQVTANTAAAEASIQTLMRQRTMEVFVKATRAGTRDGGAFAAEGARFEFYANGGRSIPALTPMSGAWAREVPANTWRVVGDRARGREWFIPEYAPNTLPLLADAAAAHGLQLVKAMADGGLLGGKPVTVPAGTSRVTNIENNLYATPSLPTADQLQRVMRESEVLAGA